MRTLDSAEQQRGAALALDQAGGVYVTSLSAVAQPDPVLDFGAFTLTNVYSFVAEYDSAGNALWARPLITTNKAAARAIAVAAPDAVFVAGDFSSSLTLGGFTLVDGTPNTTGSAFVAKLAGIGAPQISPPNLMTGNGLQFNVGGTPGYRCVVLGSSDLATWVPVATNVSPFTFADSAATNSAQRFYRAAWAP